MSSPGALKVLEAAKDPRYVRYMTVTFPWWLSHLPGGTQFNDLPDDHARHSHWYMACAELITAAEELGIFIDGWPTRRKSYPGTPNFAKHTTRRWQLRTLVKKWEDRLRVMGYTELTGQWKVYTGPDSDWKRFQAYADEFHAASNN